MSQIEVNCEYCGNPAEFVTGAIMYPHRFDLKHTRFWRCKPCQAWVGCYPSGRPLGRLANLQLRIAKQKAHEAFDTFWKYGPMTRSQAYTWLSQEMGIPLDLCHIGMFNESQCERVVEICCRMSAVRRK